MKKIEKIQRQRYFCIKKKLQGFSGGQKSRVVIAGLCVCVRACARACACLCYTHIRTRRQTDRQTHTHTDTHTHTPVCIYIYVLCIAAAMWTRPHLICLDEPTNFLDKETFNGLVRALKNFKGAVLTISHNQEFVEQVYIYI